MSMLSDDRGLDISKKCQAKDGCGCCVDQCFAPGHRRKNVGHDQNWHAYAPIRRRWQILRTFITFPSHEIWIFWFPNFEVPNFLDLWGSPVDIPRWWLADLLCPLQSQLLAQRPGHLGGWLCRMARAARHCTGGGEMAWRNGSAMPWNLGEHGGFTMDLPPKVSGLIGKMRII